jgi:hypothetical protein
VLALCRAAREEPEAALAVQRWDEWQRARTRAARGGERRFRRRAYERARENALAVLLMRAQAARGGAGRVAQPPVRMRPGSPPAGHPTTRLRVLLAHYGGRR